MTDPKRAEIKSRITQAQARDDARRDYSLVEKIEDQALEAKDKFVSFAKQHPVATVAGGLVLGVAIAAMFKTPRRAARLGGARAAGLATIGSEIALALASQWLGDTQGAGRALASGALEQAGNTAQAARASIAKRISAAAERLR